jgi:hypothetical protein
MWPKIKAKVRKIGYKNKLYKFPPQKSPEFLQVSYKFDDFDIWKVAENILIK